MGYLTASLHTAKLRGKVNRGITVESNDPAAARIQLRIRATVLTAVNLLPNENLVLTNTATRTDRSRLLIRKEPGEPGELRITDLTSSSPAIVATVTQLEAPRPGERGLPNGEPGDWLLEVELAGEQKYDPRREQLTFKTGLERQPEVTVPVNVQLRPPVNVSVKQLEIAPPTGDQPSSAALVFSVRRGLEISALEVSAEPDALRVEVKPSGSRHFTAQVSWDGGDISGGAIVFRLGEERFRVPVKVVAAKAVAARDLQERGTPAKAANQKSD